MAKGNEFGYWFRCLLHFISGRSLVPSENLVTCYKENGGNAAFLSTDCPDFTDASRVRRLAQTQATRLHHAFTSAESAPPSWRTADRAAPDIPGLGIPGKLFRLG